MSIESSCITLPLAKSGLLSPLMHALALRDDRLREVMGKMPDASGWAAAARSRKTFPGFPQMVGKAMRHQHAGLEFTQAQERNLKDLEEGRAFTVTTGHQLSVLGGPLFFFIKLAQVVRLARFAEEALPNSRVVPVFWMATEDHDLEEITRFRFYGQDLAMKVPEKGLGAVGRLDAAVVAPLREALSGFRDVDEVLALWDRHYVPGRTLSQATRSLVQEVAGAQGVLILDADDAALKACFVPWMQRELEKQESHHEVEEATRDLAELGFLPSGKGQVTPRPINLFYLEEQRRNRIVPSEVGFALADGSKTWTHQEMAAELAAHPERFSPNVVLRPLYQEVLLPNLAYVGGPGELSYWLQLPRLFSKMDVPMPLLVLRNSLVWQDLGTMQRWKKLGLGDWDWLSSEPVLQEKLLERAAVADDDFASVDQAMEAVLSDLQRRLHSADASLGPWAEAEATRIRQQVQQMKARYKKARKATQDQAFQHIRKVQQKWLPGGALHERIDNLFQYGAAWPHIWKAALHQGSAEGFSLVAVQES